MLKSCGRKLLLFLVGCMFTCLLVLMADQQKRQVEDLGGEGGRRALQSLASPGEPEGLPRQPQRQEGEPGLAPREVKSFTDYFSKLSRGRREAQDAGSLAPRREGTPRPALEDITAQDVFIAVKTTKKFHKARLELLLDTWISRNRDLVSGGAGASGARGGLQPACGRGLLSSLREQQGDVPGRAGKH
ncbi:beta-1,3-N-acetylglucosaminyltransferase lunatic fringe [Trachemys scripta elegans]|uniref:beta-1,3-N-acetylglucosaminyltransferase lunatic fringe n=1 Tax=Trachemys scripta elegans TaxID=31138 RepID=UPI00155227B4|nr:beta-1,3-N-acetylglucosaminyltransferase lunatic fringe [Trachemys scripta elegans]